MELQGKTGNKHKENNKTKRTAFTKRMCAHLDKKQTYQKTKSQKNEQKDAKRTQNYRKINKIIRKSTENQQIFQNRFILILGNSLF